MNSVKTIIAMTIFFPLATLAQAGKGSYDWKTLKKTYEENRKNYVQMTYSKEAIKMLNVKVGCNELNDKIKSCTPYQCTEAHPMSSEIFIDSAIHGFNNVGNCALSLAGMRYFVPKPKLAAFVENQAAKKTVLENKVSATLAGSLLKTTVQIELGGKKCLAKMEIETKSGGSQLIPLTASNKKQYESHKKVTTDGQEFAEPKDVTKFLKLELDPTSPAICKEKNALVNFELQRDGLTQEYESQSIGWKQPSL